ncbi:PAS domain S-box protein [Halomicroarcula sp. GCM10025817]|uniref:hybrid sensor histidine kinase/response regulator n=1 Tax=Halomicroarcula sp. GCM10025817 TaxID=3252672 RepID=UPI00361EF1E4
MPHPTVLHVDDDPALLETTEPLLQATLDCTVLSTTSAGEGHELLASERVDCVVSDYDMPGANGIEFLEAVRAEFPDLPFILFTGRGSEAVASEAIAAGVTDYVQKQVGTDQYTVLANRIENAIARHRTARDLERQRHQHEAVAELGRRALECTDPGELFETAATLVVDRLGCATARVVERKSADGRLVAVATASSGETEADPVSEPAATALAADALDQAGPVVLGDRAGEAGNAPQRQVADGVERGIGVAVGPADGHWGALTACGTAERPFSAHDVTFVQNVANVLGTAIERQVAERRMRDRDEQFREVAELSPDGIFRTDTAGRFTYVSPVSAELLRTSRDELLGVSFETLVTPESLTDAVEGFASVVAGETVRELELRLLDGNGEAFDVAVSATPITEDGETVVVQGFARDVTERKRRERALRRSRELFDGLVEHFPNGGVFLFDEDLRFTVVGGDELERGGLSAEEMTGKRPSEVFPPANAAVLEDAYRAALSGEKRSFEDSYQGRHYHVQTLPIRDADGTVAAGMAVAQNITDRTHAREALEERNRRLDEFAAVVSHDLRGPLNVAMGRLELARQDCRSDHLDPLERAHERMEELVESLLTLARQGQPIGETSAAALETVAQECWATVATGPARLRVDGDCRFQADDSRLRQLLENLFRNAVEHGPGEEDGTVTVRVGALPDGFYVEDDGVGLTDLQATDIFERAVTTKANGTGFGLTTVGEIVAAHGWSVEARDGDDGGFRVEITGVETA